MVLLDPNFGVNGKVITSLNLREFGSDLLIDPNGTIFVAASASEAPNDFSDYDFKLLRYSSSGVRDTSFNGTGNFPKDTAISGTIVLQADGKILVGGQTFNTFSVSSGDEGALARYNPDGSLDSSFGLNGIITNRGTLFGTIVLPLSDGKILTISDRKLARYTSSGTLDTSFNPTETISTAFGEDGYASVLLPQPDGKVIAVGTTDGSAANDSAFVLARYDMNGNLDPSFGIAGKTITNFAGFSDEPTAVTLQADGKIVVVGTSLTGSGLNDDFDIAIARYNTNGTLDSTFGTGGKVTLDFLGGNDSAANVHIQPDGKIIVTGTVDSDPGFLVNRDFAILRFNADGTLDTSFDTDGKLISDLGGQDSLASSVLVDGKLTVLGNTFNNNGDRSIALVRYVLSNSPTDFSLSNPTVAENQPVGTIVGNFSAIDPDINDTFTYSLVTGTGSSDNAAFEIVGNQLKTKQTFDFETKKDYSIRVKTTDAAGASLEKELKLSITDVAELPPTPPIVTPKQPKPTGDPIVGNAKNNRLPGTAQDDLIRGLKGNDKLNGKGGNDILVGGAGNDLLRGGAGDDVFRGGQGKDTSVLNGGFDRVQGFVDGQDKFKLVGLSFTNLTITQQGSDTLVQSGSNPILLITGVNNSLITAADFI